MISLNKAKAVLDICKRFWAIQSTTNQSFCFKDLLLAVNHMGIKTEAGNAFSSTNPRAAANLLKAAYKVLEQAHIADRWMLLEIKGKGGKGGYLWRK